MFEDEITDVIEGGGTNEVIEAEVEQPQPKLAKFRADKAFRMAEDGMGLKHRAAVQRGRMLQFDPALDSVGRRFLETGDVVPEKKFKG